MNRKIKEILRKLPKPTKADKPWNCPHCYISLLGKPIPKKYLHMYAGRYYKREIGRYDLVLDVTAAYQCPDCKNIWSRREHDELRKPR